MIKKLQFIVAVTILFSSFANAQNDRSNLKVIEKPSVISVTEPAMVYPNIEEKSVPKGQLKPVAGEIRPDFGNPSAPQNTPAVSGSRRSNPSNNAKSNNPSTDAPIYPDLQVNAIKEGGNAEVQSNVERKPEQLVSIQQLASDEQASKATDPNSITLSPLKRKYLEGVAAGLEKEILSNPDNTSTEMLAKKKELEDLKKLLAH